MRTQVLGQDYYREKRLASSSDKAAEMSAYNYNTHSHITQIKTVE